MLNYILFTYLDVHNTIIKSTKYEHLWDFKLVREDIKHQNKITINRFNLNTSCISVVP